MTEPSSPEPIEGAASAAFREAPVGLVVVDRERGLVVYANTAALRLLGLAGASGPSPLPPVLVQLMRTHAGEDRWRELGVALGGEAEGPGVDVSAHPSVSGAASVLVLEPAPLTVGRRALGELEQRVLHVMFDHLPDSVCVSAADRTVQYMNRAAQREFGEGVGRHCYEVLHGRDEPCEEDFCRLPHALQGEASVRADWHCARNGKWYDIIAVPLYGADGSVGQIEVFRDVTGRKEADQALRARNEELAAKNQEMDLFVRTIAHDLRTPAVATEGMARLLERRFGAVLGDDGRDYLAAIRDMSRHMIAMISQLSALARAGAQRTASQEVDVGEVVDRAARELAFQLQDGGIQLRVADHLPTVRADPTMLTQVFVNLMGNAVKFVTQAPQPFIEVDCEETEPAWVFHVRDNGIGVPAGSQDRVFEAFTKAENNPGAEGTGLGLAIVKKIVEAPGGKVWVSDTAGGGATFSFTVPKEPPPTDQPASSAA